MLVITFPQDINGSISVTVVCQFIIIHSCVHGSVIIGPFPKEVLFTGNPEKINEVLI